MIGDVESLHERPDAERVVPVLRRSIVEPTPFVSQQPVVPHLEVLHPRRFAQHAREIFPVDHARLPPSHVRGLRRRDVTHRLSEVGVHEEGFPVRTVLHHGVPQHLRPVVVPHPHVIRSLRHQSVLQPQVQQRHGHDLLISESHVSDGERVEEIAVRVHEQRQPKRVPNLPLVHQHLPGLVRERQLRGVTQHHLTVRRARPAPKIHPQQRPGPNVILRVEERLGVAKRDVIAVHHQHLLER